MYSTVQHTRFFRLIYNAAPCSNVLCRVMIGVRNMTTMFTTKAFPISVTHMQAIRTHLRSVSRWNSKQFHPFAVEPYSQILPELVKAQRFNSVFCILLCPFAVLRIWLKSSIAIPLFSVFALATMCFAMVWLFIETNLRSLPLSRFSSLCCFSRL